VLFWMVAHRRPPPVSQTITVELRTRLVALDTTLCPPDLPLVRFYFHGSAARLGG
jgi:hypothetical protein